MTRIRPDASPAGKTASVLQSVRSAGRGRRRTRGRKWLALGVAGVAAAMLIDSPRVAALTTNGPNISAGSQPISFHGGPVLEPTIGCLMWSPNSTAGLLGIPYFSAAEVAAANKYLTGVQQYMSNYNLNIPSGTEPAIRQYGVWGASVVNCVVDHGNLPTSPIPWDATARPTIQAEIQRAQSQLGLIPFGPETVIVVLTKGIQFASPYGVPGGSCAYHSELGTVGSGQAGTNQYFALVPFPATTDCVNGNATNEFQTLLSHEIFEAATDPMVGTANAAWYSNVQKNPEIGDNCPGAQLTFPDGSTGYVSQVVDDVSGSCQTFAAKEMFPVTAVKTGTNTINVIFSRPEGANMLSHLTGDGVNWNFSTIQSFTGTTTDAPSAVTPDGQIIDVYVRGTDGGLYQQRFDGTQWLGWLQLQGTIVGPPVAFYNFETGMEDIWAMGTDANIYRWALLPSTCESTLYATPTQVLASGPPRIESLSNSGCYFVYYSGMRGDIWASRVCGDPATMAYSRFTKGGPTLFSPIQNFTTENAIVNTLSGNLVGNNGGFVPKLEEWVANTVFQGATFPNSVGPISAVALGGVAVAAGRGPGASVGALLGMTSAISPISSTLNFGTPTQLATGVLSAPYVFTADGKTADVFYNTSPIGTLQHVRFDGTAWQAPQNFGLVAP